MIGLERGKVMLAFDNNGYWKLAFEEERNRLGLLLGQYIIDIQHIGSTAIKGISAKPIIDIAVGLKNWKDVKAVKDILEHNGYYYRQNGGDENRLFFAKGEETCRTHYLHVYEYGSIGWKNHTFFCNFLNTHECCRNEYAKLKKQLSLQFSEDRDAYTNGKEDFIRSIINRKEREYMIRCVEDVRYYAEKYQMPTEDIIMIALNAMGVDADMEQPRLRMRLSLRDKESEQFYMGLANHPETPFHMVKGKIFLDGEYVADTINVENDDCASSYFRKNSKVITLNSNRRSSCRGCRFCPNNLELNSEDDNLDTVEKLRNHFHGLMEDKGLLSLADMERITVCTGCFGTEEKALRHLLMVYDVIAQMGFTGQFHYIGSEIVSEHAYLKIKEQVAQFMYTFTVECFTGRDRMLKDVKSKIELDTYRDYMRRCKTYGFKTNIIYVLGLDSLKDTLKWLDKFVNVSNSFPLINIFQPHVPEHYELLSADARRMDYYLTVRKFIEYKFKNRAERHQSWECYRPLCYFAFGEEKLECVRI